MTKVLFSIAACSGALAVILGAFGAHVLKSQLTASALETYQTAVFYHFVHTLALLIVVLLYQQKPESRMLLFSACSFLIGLLFGSCCTSCQLVFARTSELVLCVLDFLPALRAGGCPPEQESAS